MIVGGRARRREEMASLRWPEDATRLDFELMRESPVRLYRSSEVLHEHARLLRLERRHLHA